MDTQSMKSACESRPFAVVSLTVWLSQIVNELPRGWLTHCAMAFLVSNGMTANPAGVTKEVSRDRFFLEF